MFNQMLKRWKLWFGVSALIVGLSFCLTRIGAGHVGIVVNLAGSNRGVDDIPLKTGWVFYFPLTEQVFSYPTYVHTAIWSANHAEGNPLNEEISFNSKKGTTMTVDLSVSYRLEASKVPAFYTKFRTDLETYTHSFLHNVTRDSFSEIASQYETDEIYGIKKDEVLQAVCKRINDKVNPYGVVIEQFGIVGAVRLPEAVLLSLNASQAAVQKSIQTENELRQVQAEAKKNIAEAEGRAGARLATARAEAEANLILGKSITPELVKWKTIAVMEKWDGHRPLVEGGNSGFMFQMPLAVPASIQADTAVVPAK